MREQAITEQRFVDRFGALALVLVCVLALSGLAALAPDARAATIEVSTTEDPSGAGSCPESPCSLRQAVAAASEGDTIQLAGERGKPLSYTLTQGSPIVVDKSITILGNGIDESVINGKGNVGGEGGQNRILKLTGGNVRIAGIGFTGGVDGEDENLKDCDPCYTINANGGGAIYNAGATLTLDEVAFVANGTTSAQPVGGAISNSGNLDMEDVIFEDDGAAYGGGLFARGGTVTANRVTFQGDGPDAFDGGAVFLYGDAAASLANTTIVESGWPSSFGGGIDNDEGSLTLTNDTLSGNIRGSLETDVGSITRVQNTILGSGFSDSVDFDCLAAGKENAAGTTTAKAITEDLGNNIDQDGACGLDAAGDHSGVDPKLVAPSENGGFVPTQALIHGSPALEGANAAACPATDARGVLRPQGSVCDIGAFEAQLIGAPGAKTEPAEVVNSEEEELAASIRLDGEAGGFHFLWGTAADELTNETTESPAGVFGGEAYEIYLLAGLRPETTYYYEAVADNASGSAAAKNIRCFTTPAAGGGEPPACQGPSNGEEEEGSKGGGEGSSKSGGETPSGQTASAASTTPARARFSVPRSLSHPAFRCPHPCWARRSTSKWSAAPCSSRSPPARAPAWPPRSPRPSRTRGWSRRSRASARAFTSSR